MGVRYLESLLWSHLLIHHFQKFLSYVKIRKIKQAQWKYKEQQ